MRVADQPAFVLHAKLWRETSLLIDCLTRDHGRIALIARGVVSPKKQALRAALQPLQKISLSYTAKSELGQLTQAEALDTAPQLSGDTLLASFYIHELLLALLPKNDAASGVFEHYRLLRERWRSGEDLAWSLRRFERDLLQDLGFGLAFDRDYQDSAIFPERHYQLNSDSALIACAKNNRSVSGQALLCLAQDIAPPPELRTDLRKLMRQCIEPHLSGRELRSWSMMNELALLRS
jgi:DNA repair protein RecO (recombination protein O)